MSRGCCASRMDGIMEYGNILPGGNIYLFTVFEAVRSKPRSARILPKLPILFSKADGLCRIADCYTPLEWRLVTSLGGQFSADV
jgi:hypothetical protein